MDNGQLATRGGSLWRLLFFARWWNCARGGRCGNNFLIYGKIRLVGGFDLWPNWNDNTVQEEEFITRMGIKEMESGAQLRGHIARRSVFICFCSGSYFDNHYIIFPIYFKLKTVSKYVILGNF